MPRAARCIVSREAIAAAYFRANGQADRPIVSPEQLAELLTLSRKTIYAWIAQGRLDGSFRQAWQAHFSSGATRRWTFYSTDLNGSTKRNAE